MMRMPLTIFLVCFTLALCAQDDPVYRRGWQISASFGPEREPDIYVYSGQRTDLEFLPEGDQRRLITERVGQDSLFYLYEPLGGDYAALPSTTQRFNLQLRAHRRYLSGLEFVTGVFYSAGKIGTERTLPPGLAEDIRYATYSERYSRFGVSSGVHFNFMKSFRFQPYLGLNVLLLHERFRRDHYTIVLPAQGIERENDPETTTPGPTTNFRLDLRPVFGFNYSLNFRWNIGLEISPVLRQYAGLQLRYRITEY